MFYVPIQPRNKCQGRLDHTGVWVPTHEIESGRSVARAGTPSGIPRSSCFFFMFFFSLPAMRRTHARRWTPTVGCSDLLIPVLFHDQDQRGPLYNDVLINDNIATVALLWNLLPYKYYSFCAGSPILHFAIRCGNTCIRAILCWIYDGVSARKIVKHTN